MKTQNVLQKIKEEGPDFLFKAAGVIGGVVLCRVGKTKVFKLAKDPTSGKWVTSDGQSAGLKPFIPAAVVTIGGFAGKILVDNKIAKSLLEGLAIGGLIDGVSVIFTKATLQGFGMNGLLGEGEIEMGAVEQRIPLQINTYEPDINELDGPSETNVLLQESTVAGLGDLYDDEALLGDAEENPLAKENYS